jgi:ClpP class serine protease
MIFKAKEQKTVIAYVYGLGASAAYWIASAASEIVLAETGEVGSIGVVAAYTSRKEERKKKGIEDYEIVSSQSPNKRPDPATQTGKSQIQATVDQLADIFIGAIARNRGVEVKDVLENYGKGGVLVGNEAIESGLADRIGSLETLITEQKAKQTKTFFSGGSMTLQELKE